MSYQMECVAGESVLQLGVISYCISTELDGALILLLCREIKYQQAIDGN
jgi:hypothetical protein